MKILEAALLLVVGTLLLTFSGLSFMLAPRALTVSNPSLFVELLFIAGAVFAGLGVRSLYRIHRALSAKGLSSSAQVTAV